MAQDNVNIPVTGMVDAHPLNVKENQYPFMLNGNIMTDISSAVTLTNEHSNYLCNNLPEGFVVIATMFVHEDVISYLWLVNPATGASEIGYLREYQFIDVEDRFVPNDCNDCIKKKEEAPPLETQVQPQLCTYVPIVTDGPCCALGFDLDFPVRKGVIKKDNCGDSIYFTDFLNPPRVLKLQPITHLPDNTQRCVASFTPEPCPEPVYDADPTHVDCDAIRLFPLAEHMHVTPDSVGVGGSLIAGVYQLAACYADQFGQRATRTFVTSNPVSIFDTNKTVTDQVNYPTDKSIKFTISNINNTDYRFIDLFVVATQNGVSTVRQFNTIDIGSLMGNTLQFVLSDFEKGKPATIDDIFQVFPVYELAQEITSAGNSLLLGNLTGPKDLNLQEAAVYLSPFLQWKSYEADEDIYADGAAAANFRGFLRDEVYALGIVFERNNTLDTCVYPLVGRAINSVVDDGTVDSDCPDGYQYYGYWLVDGPEGGVYPDKAIVTFEDVSYVNTSGGDSTAADVPGVSGLWTLVTSANAADFCIFPDDDIIDNDDVITPPGCDSDTPDLRWQVYNTAFNRGQPCDYSPVGIVCAQKLLQIKCNSYTFIASTLIIENLVGLFEVGDTVTGAPSGATGLVINVTHQAGTPAYITLETNSVTGAFVDTDSISGSISGATADIADDGVTVGDPEPFDCFVDSDNTVVNCEDNYPTPYDDVSVEAADITCVDGECCPNPDPTANQDPDCPAAFGLVRSQSDAAAASAVNELCIDSVLAIYPNNISNPYAYKTGHLELEVTPLSTNDYYVYPALASIIAAVPRPPSPVPSLSGSPMETCITFTPENNGTWIWADNFSSVAVNYSPGNAITVPTVATNDQGCQEYSSTSQATINILDPIRYFLGYPASQDCSALGCAPCGGGCVDQYCDCVATAADYWSLGTQAFMPGSTDQNVTQFQSRWYKITARTPSLTIKMKLGFPVAGQVHQDGDIRIDVYEGAVGSSPKWSTGEDATAPADAFYANVGDVDTGVLIIGDVANSVQKYAGPGATNPVDDLPLIQGETYYIHCYIMAGSNAETYLDSAPVCNPDHDSQDPVKSNCPCVLPPFAWANFCVDYPSSATTRAITTPAINRIQCSYDLLYRLQEVFDPGCELQPFDFGDFAYWQALTKKYPTSRDQNGIPLWGPLCGRPIRHFKFPDCLVSYHQNQDPLITGVLGGVTDYPYNPGRTAKVYPLGLKVNTEDVKTWLAWAVSVGRITQAEHDSITGYKLVRANRATNKSIGAKGLVTDMWNYNEFDWVSGQYSQYNTYFPNYPFNDITDNDPYLNRGGIGYAPPNGGTSNSRFTFHSPETSFNSPTLGTELKFESGLYGGALGSFYQVDNHPKYVLLSSGGIVLASVLAGIQLSADLLILIGELLGNYLVGFSFTVPVGSIIGIVGATLNTVPNFFIYAQRWEELIKSFGVPQNFAYYYAAVGNYHSSGVLGQILNTGHKRRGVLNGTYLLAGNLSINESGNLSKINNYQREDSVYFNLNTPFAYAGTAINDSVLRDSSKFIMSQSPAFQTVANTVETDPNICGLVERKSKVAGNYAAMKYYVPDQYGSLQDIEWLYTGVFSSLDYNNTQDTTCDIMLGGDQFICRFTKYIKLPFFLDNPVGVVTGVDFQYRRLSNITNSTFYFNSVGESTLNSSSVQFTEVEHNFDCETTGAGMYLKGNMYLFNYGVMSFICESDFNLNFRRATDITTTRGFYPYQSDIENVTQEFEVPIQEPNHYLINRDYNKQNKENFFCSQPTIYNNSACITTYRNRLISSIPDTDSDFYRDNWKIFLGADYKDYPLTNGLLWGIDGIERDKVIIRFADTTLVLNAFYTINTNAGSAQLGNGSLFSTKPEELVKASIGFGGTQSHAFISTPMGHFWVDAERHKVFVMFPSQPGVGSTPTAISDSYDTFFITNLPFFILRDFPNFAVDNPWKDVGIAMDWDYRFNRLFLTKLDYSLLPQWRALAATPLSAVTPSTPALHYFTRDEVPFPYTEAGVFLVTTDGVVTEYAPIELTNTDYFCNKSWTLSYSPLLKTWISFYSFMPNYYIGHAKYMQTGVNFVRPGADRLGIWNHFISNRSYQVFYGTLYPFITDVIVQEQLYNKQLHSIEYQADYLRFQNDYDYFYNPGLTFNKMVIWAENQNSGNLELVVRAQNDFSQNLLYPRINPNSTSVLVARTENNWGINQFCDLVADKFSNVPPMILGCSPFFRQVNPDAINYNKPTFQRQHFTSDYMTLRFINDAYSNYKIINKWFLNKTIKSYS